MQEGQSLQAGGTKRSASSPAGSGRSKAARLDAPVSAVSAGDTLRVEPPLQFDYMEEADAKPVSIEELELSMQAAFATRLDQNDLWKANRRKVASSESLKRFLRWLLHGGCISVACSASSFVRACAQLLKIAKDGSGIPESLMPFAGGMHLTVESAWSHVAPCIKADLAVQQAVAAAVQDLSTSTRIASAALVKLYDIVRQPHCPSDADEGAVWRHFRWTRAVCKALTGGRSKYLEWVHHMTAVGNAPFEEDKMLKALTRSFHWIGRHKVMPGMVVGSMTQVRVPAHRASADLSSASTTPSKISGEATSASTTPSKRSGEATSASTTPNKISGEATSASTTSSKSSGEATSASTTSSKSSGEATSASTTSSKSSGEATSASTTSSKSSGEATSASTTSSKRSSVTSFVSALSGSGSDTSVPSADESWIAEDQGAGSTQKAFPDCLRRVLVEYGSVKGGKPKQSFAALLVTVPIMVDEVREEVPETDSTVLWRRGDDGKQVPVRIAGSLVSCLPFALTMPRLHLLYSIARCIETGHPGIALSGVHGAGKTSTLTAIVGILAVGSETESLFSMSPSELESLDLQATLECCLRGSGQLARQLWRVASPAHEAFNKAWLMSQKDHLPGRAFLRAMQNKDGSLFAPKDRGCVVIVLDEVNDLLTEIGHDSAVRHDPATGKGFWQDWLPWREYGRQRRVFRILASSPHGKREEITQKVSKFRVPFELRPAPADHLAAVMAEAPAFLCGPDGADVSPLPIQDCFYVCNALGGNARYIARFLDERTATSHPAELCEETLTKECAMLKYRFLKFCSRVTQSDVAQKASLQELAALDASLVVRRKVHDVDSTSLLVAGHPALLALLSAAHMDYHDSEHAKIVEMVRKNDFEAGVVLGACIGVVAQNSRPLHLLHNLDEVEIYQVNPCHGILNSRFLNVKMTSESISCQLLQSSYEPGSGVESSAAGPGDEPRQPNTILAGHIVCTLRKMLRAAAGVTHETKLRVVFQTVNNFPGIDVIGLELLGSKVQVTFYEATVSTLYDHAKKRSAHKALFQQDDGKMKKGKVQVDPPLRDVLTSCASGATVAAYDKKTGHVTLKYTQKGAGNTFVYPHSNWDNALYAPDSVKTGTSTVNCLLASMGVPLVLRRSILMSKQPSPVGPVASADGSDEALKSPEAGEWSDVIEGAAFMKLEVEVCESLCDELYGDKSWKVEGVKEWSFRMVYASKTPVELNNSGHYCKLFAKDLHGVFAGDLLSSK